MGARSDSVPARTPGQPLQVVPEQPGGYVMVSSERATLPSAFAAAAMAASGAVGPQGHRTERDGTERDRTERGRRQRYRAERGGGGSFPFDPPVPMTAAGTALVGDRFHGGHGWVCGRDGGRDGRRNGPRRHSATHPSRAGQPGRASARPLRVGQAGRRGGQYRPVSRWRTQDLARAGRNRDGGRTGGVDGDVTGKNAIVRGGGDQIVSCTGVSVWPAQIP